MLKFDSHLLRREHQIWLIWTSCYLTKLLQLTVVFKSHTPTIIIFGGNRPYSQYPPSLDAHENDGKNKVKWFLRGQTSENIGQCKKFWSSLLILDKFHLKKTIMKSYRLKTIVTFLDVVATIDVLTANGNDVNLVKTWTVQFVWLFVFLVFKNQTWPTGRSFWQIFSLVFPLK